MDNYIDYFTLSKDDVKIYDIKNTYNNLLKKIQELKIARNKFIDGYHVRITSNYQPKIEMTTKKKRDMVSFMVEDILDSKQAYDEFNIELCKLFKIMSRAEVAYINDCLIENKSETYVRDKLKLTRTEFYKAKISSIVRFGLAFNIIVYK